MSGPDLGDVIAAAQQYGDDRAAAQKAEDDARLVAAVADQKALDDVALAAVRAEFDAYKASHPDTPPPPDPKPEPAPTVKLGAAFKQGENLPAAVKRIDFFRHFFQPGEMAGTTRKTWAGEANLVKAHDTYGCRTFSISFKPDGSGTPFATPANIERFLDTIPADVKPADVLLSFYHEHDGNIRDGSLSIDTYRAGSRVVADIAHKRGMKFGPIHNAVVQASGKWGLLPAVWAANEADLALYDFWGVDCYSPEYEDPAVRMKPIADYAKSLGLPLLIGELAAPPTDAAKQTAWAKSARSWALANTRWASWWSSQLSGKPDWRLTDGAAREWFGI